MDEAKMIQIHKMVKRSKYELLESKPAFLHPQSAADLLDLCESQVDALIEAGVIPSVTLHDMRLIPLLSLIDEMDWYPASTSHEEMQAGEASTESQIEESLS